MAEFFYDHLLILEEIVVVLKAKHLSKEEQKKLLQVIDEALYHHILDEILTHLPKKHHDNFLKKFVAKPNDSTLLPFLQEHTTVDMEKKILTKANTVKKDIITTLHKHAPNKK